eukprot:267643-Amphidinium_carterae.1
MKPLEPVHDSQSSARRTLPDPALSIQKGIYAFPPPQGSLEYRSYLGKQEENYNGTKQQLYKGLVLPLCNAGLRVCAAITELHGESKNHSARSCCHPSLLVMTDDVRLVASHGDAADSQRALAFDTPSPHIGLQFCEQGCSTTHRCKT